MLQHCGLLYVNVHCAQCFVHLLWLKPREQVRQVAEAKHKVSPQYENKSKRLTAETRREPDYIFDRFLFSGEHGG